jgi:Fe/S biogenesis protein NfuA
MTMIEITESGQGYLRDLLAKQNCEGIAIRVFVLDGGTPKAETCIAFCRPGEQEADDEMFPYTGFNAWVDKKSKPYLDPTAHCRTRSTTSCSTISILA